MGYNNPFYPVVHSEVMGKPIKEGQRQDLGKDKIAYQLLGQELVRQNQRSQANKVAHQLPFKKWRHSVEVGIDNLDHQVPKQVDQDQTIEVWLDPGVDNPAGVVFRDQDGNELRGTVVGRSVLQFAVEVLQVRHVIVCGHYNCGGVKAALSNKQLGLINKWLRNIKDTYQLHRDEIEAMDDEEARVDRLVELNVREQVVNLAKTSIVQLSWKRRQLPVLHGWVYGLKDGILKQLAMMGPDDDLDPIYRYELDALE